MLIDLVLRLHPQRWRCYLFQDIPQSLASCFVVFVIILRLMSIKLSWTYQGESSTRPPLAVQHLYNLLSMTVKPKVVILV